MSLGGIRNLDYTILLCSNLPATKAFYLDVMGFPLAHDSERWRGTMARSFPARLPSSSPSGSRHT